MKSMQKPKKIYIYGSDGKIYGFLVKAKDDLRKDARTMEFNYMINSFLKKNPESRDSELCKCLFFLCKIYVQLIIITKLDIRTYAVIPIGDQWGLIEWIENIQPLKGIVNELWQAQGNQGVQVSNPMIYLEIML
jgi:serine/threonine-protein kinase ATR